MSDQVEEKPAETPPTRIVDAPVNPDTPASGASLMQAAAQRLAEQYPDNAPVVTIDGQPHELVPTPIQPDYLCTACGIGADHPMKAEDHATSCDHAEAPGIEVEPLRGDGEVHEAMREPEPIRAFEPPTVGRMVRYTDDGITYAAVVACDIGASKEPHEIDIAVFDHLKRTRDGLGAVVFKHRVPWSATGENRTWAWPARS